MISMIEGYPNYWIRSDGLIINKKTARVMKQSITNSGYLNITLTNQGKQKCFFVHKLVANHFIPNLDNLPEVNHKDANRFNNHHKNLEHCTKEYNMHLARACSYYFYNPVGSLVKVTNLARFCREHNLIRVRMHLLNAGKIQHHRGWTNVISASNRPT